MKTEQDVENPLSFFDAWYGQTVNAVEIEKYIYYIIE